MTGKGYKAYKGLSGRYHWPTFSLDIDHIQGDPYAAPSRVCVRVAMARVAVPEHYWNTAARQVALQDYFARCVARNIQQIVCKGSRGSGKSGEIAVCAGQQQVLPRNAVLLDQHELQARLTMGLPAAGRAVRIDDAQEMFFNELPAIVARSLFFAALDEAALAEHVYCVEDQHALRDWLHQQRLVGFVANGARLARHSGIDDHPLADQIPFQSPPSLQKQVSLPNAGNIQGMAIPEGVTLIVGGGFHGKSTLLHALEHSVYNHLPGDGREQVVMRANAVKIRAEDGRAISHVDISPFINHLPFGRDTTTFSTQNASGSTSQASNIVEALHAQADVLLIDEDTSATNFMIRDRRMQALVADAKEPITPLVQRIRDLYVQHGVSCVIVMGGSGDYFDAADTVIMMDTYQPQEVTQQAKALAQSVPQAAAAKSNRFARQGKRRPQRAGLDCTNAQSREKIAARGKELILYGEQNINLTLVEQIVDDAQTRAIGLMMRYYYQHHWRPERDLIAGLSAVLAEVEGQGLDILSAFRVGDLALPRLYEVAAAVNRMRDTQWENVAE